MTCRIEIENRLYCLKHDASGKYVDVEDSILHLMNSNGFQTVFEYENEALSMFIVRTTRRGEQYHADMDFFDGKLIVRGRDD